MKTVSYVPSRDELVVGTCRGNGGNTREFGPFKLCWDRKLVIHGFSIRGATQLLREFRKSLRVVPLGGILRHVQVSDADIRESRSELLKRLENGW